MKFEREGSFFRTVIRGGGADFLIVKRGRGQIFSGSREGGQNFWGPQPPNIMKKICLPHLFLVDVDYKDLDRGVLDSFEKMGGLTSKHMWGGGGVKIYAFPPPVHY